MSPSAATTPTEASQSGTKWEIYHASVYHFGDNYIAKCSVNIRPNFGQRLVNLRLNFGRKGGEEAGCLVDESCLEQSVS